MRDEAASPLAVILTFVLVAVGITTLVFFLVVDTQGPVVSVQAIDGGFEVIEVTDGIDWSELDVRFIDRAGADQSMYLNVPTGLVEEGDGLLLRSTPPQGTYVLIISLEGQEMSRVRAEL